MTERTGILVMSDPAHLRAYVLRPEVALDAISGTGADVVFGVTPGVGKTTSYIALIISRLWQERGFGQVVVLLPTRKVLKEVEKKLMESGLSVVAYPSVDDPDDTPCVPNHRDLKQLIGRGLSLHAHMTICAHCPLRNSCKFQARYQVKRFHSADVILACDAPLTRDPEFVMRIARPDERILPIVDEAVAVREGFVQTFTESDVQRELEIAQAVGDEAVGKGLDHLLQRPNVRWAGSALALASLPVWQSEGARRWKDYRFGAPAMLAYLRAPLWYEDGVYAVARPPHLPWPMLFYGANLTAELMQWRFGRASAADALPRPVVVRHPDTRVVVISNGTFTPSNWPGNASAIGAFAADLLISEAEKGRTVCLLGRKDGPSDPWATRALVQIRNSLLARGAGHIQLLDPTQPLPGQPQVGVVPLVTIGAIGVNAYEEYDTILQVVAYYAPVEAIRAMAFNDLAPGDRPALELDQRRRPVWKGQLAEVRRRRVAMAIRMLEIDPLVQGLCRVRGSIKPRLLVACTRHDLTPHLGPVEVVKNITEARIKLNLGTTLEKRWTSRFAAIEALHSQGVPLSEVATRVGISYSTVRRIASAAGLKVKPGRPAS